MKLEHRQINVDTELPEPVPNAWCSPEETKILMCVAKLGGPVGGPYVTPKRIIEIGTNRGQTTVNLALAQAMTVPGGDVCTWEVMPKYTTPETPPKHEIGEAFREYDAMKITQLFVNPTKSLADHLKLADYMPYDMAFIDGNHSYESTRDAALSILPRLSLGGVILFHDVWWDHDAQPEGFAPPLGPMRLLEEWADDPARRNIEAPYIANGTHIGIVRVL